MNSNGDTLRSVLAECRTLCGTRRKQLAARIDRLLSDPEAAARVAADRLALTPAHRETLLAFARYRAEHGVSPTFRELGRIRGLSSPTLFGHFRELRRKGLIGGEPHKTRAMRLLV